MITDKKNLIRILIVAIAICILVIMVNQTNENSVVRKDAESTTNVFRRTFEDGKEGLRNVAEGIDDAIYNKDQK